MFNLQKLSALLGLFSSNAPVPYANRNLFVDGRFDSWSSTGSTLSNAGAYSAAAMWIAASGTGGTAALTQTDARVIAAGNTDSGPRYAMVFGQSVASSGTVAARTAPFIFQRIEGVQRLAGRSVTLSFRLYVTSGQITIPAILAARSYGTGGSPSAVEVFDKAINWVVTTTPKKFSVRVDIPAASAKTYGTNGDDCTSLGLWLPPGVTFTMVCNEAQCEISDPNSSSDINGAGGAATTFEYRGEQAETARIQRYYQAYSIGSSSIIVIGTIASASTAYGSIGLSVPMRSVPAGSIISAMTWTGGSLAGAAVTVTSPGPSVAILIATGSGGSPGQSGYFAGNAAGGSIVVLDSRL